MASTWSTGRRQCDRKRWTPLSSPYELLIWGETYDRYRNALLGLTSRERKLIIARIELGCTAAEIAHQLKMPTPEAARMAVSRALRRLAKALGRVNRAGIAKERIM